MSNVYRVLVGHGTYYTAHTRVEKPYLHPSSPLHLSRSCRFFPSPSNNASHTSENPMTTSTHQHQYPLPEVFVRPEIRQSRQQRPRRGDHNNPTGSIITIPMTGISTSTSIDTRRRMVVVMITCRLQQERTRCRITQQSRHERMQGVVKPWRGVVEYL